MPAPAQNHRAWIESISPPWAAGENAAAYYGVTLGLVGDLLAEGLRLALLMPWLLEDESPDDVLPLVGSELRMPRYPTETSAAYRARLVDAGNRYANAGTFTRINAEIVAAGYSGTVYVDVSAPGPGLVTPWYSQFWILTSGISAESLATQAAIARKWKSARWMFRGFIINDPPTLRDPMGVGDVVSVGEGWVG